MRQVFEVWRDISGLDLHRIAPGKYKFVPWAVIVCLGKRLDSRGLSVFVAVWSLEQFFSEYSSSEIKLELYLVRVWLKVLEYSQQPYPRHGPTLATPEAYLAFLFYETLLSTRLCITGAAHSVDFRFSVS